MPRILVAETNAAIRSLLRYILETRGYDVDPVADGAQAIDSMIVFEPDLVITNIKMPEIDGFSLIKAIRRMPPSKAKVPIVVLSNDASRENVIRSIQCGGNDFVSKSELEVRTLLAKIDSLLGEDAVAAADEVVAAAEEAAAGAGTRSETAHESRREKAFVPEPEPVKEDGPVYKLPNSDQIAETVSGLVGRDVKVKRCREQDLAEAGPYLYGVYIQSEGEKVAAISISELKLGAFAGAALSLIPLEVAKGFIKKQALDEEMFENYEEVFNVSAALFNRPNVPHLRLRTAHQKLDEVPDDATPLLEKFKIRADFEVDIADYGSGKMTLVAI